MNYPLSCPTACKKLFPDPLILQWAGTFKRHLKEIFNSHTDKENTGRELGSREEWWIQVWTCWLQPYVKSHQAVQRIVVSFAVYTLYHKICFNKNEVEQDRISSGTRRACGCQAPQLGSSGRVGEQVPSSNPHSSLMGIMWHSSQASLWTFIPKCELTQCSSALSGCYWDIYIYISLERGGERNIIVWEKHRLVASHMCPTGD